MRPRLARGASMPNWHAVESDQRICEVLRSPRGAVLAWPSVGQRSNMKALIAACAVERHLPCEALLMRSSQMSVKGLLAGNAMPSEDANHTAMIRS